MELKLQKLADNLVAITDIQDLDDSNVIVVRLSNTVAAKLNIIACSKMEPLNMVLPLNVSWLCLDPTSQNYGKFLVRSSKTPTAPFSNTWVPAFYYQDVFLDQYYDDDDQQYLQDTSIVQEATPTRNGIVKISVNPIGGNPPVAVAEGDPRLSDARTPLAHTHPLLPATQLKTATGVVTINTATAPQAGQVLYATGPTQAQWKFLSRSDVPGLT